MPHFANMQNNKSPKGIVSCWFIQSPFEVHIESLNPPLGARCSICAWLTWIFNFDFRLSDCCCDFRFPHIYTFALPAKVNKNSWEMICKQRDAHGAFYCSRQVALLEAAAPFFIHCRAKSRSPSISASTCLNLSWLATLSVNPAMKNTVWGLVRYRYLSRVEGCSLLSFSTIICLSVELARFQSQRCLKSCGQQNIFTKNGLTATDIL